MTDNKWFFPIQTKVTKFLNERFDDYECQYQDVCENRVYENYACYNGSKLTGYLIIVMRKTLKDFIVFEMIN